MIDCFFSKKIISGEIIALEEQTDQPKFSPLQSTKTAAITQTATDPPKANLFKTAPLLGPGAAAGVSEIVEVGTPAGEELVSGGGEGGEVVVTGDGASAVGGGVFKGEGADTGGFTVAGAGAEAFDGDLEGEVAGEDAGDCAMAELTRKCD
ncbi:hypothetical protein OIU78_025809 [Salix suchowensis]|nr:hypothetical protein OIU78_025809 [Salix suchowensis]